MSCDCSTTEGESELSTDQGTEQLPIIYPYKGAPNILLLYIMSWGKSNRSLENNFKLSYQIIKKIIQVGAVAV